MWPLLARQTNTFHLMRKLGQIGIAAVAAGVAGLVVGLVLGLIWGLGLGDTNAHIDFCADSTSGRYIIIESLRRDVCR